MAVPIRDASLSDFAQTVLARSHEVPVVVDFWAAWCGPCRVLGPVLEKLAAEAGGEWELVKVDVDRNQPLAMQLGIQGIPTVIGFKNGEPVARFTGALPEEAVKQWLRELVPTEADRLAEEGKALRDAGDAEEAEAAFRRALESDPSHHDAAVGLASLLIEREDLDTAEAVLRPLADTEEVGRLRSTIRTKRGAGDIDELRQRVELDPQDLQARLAYARGLAAAGHAERAMDEYLFVIGSGDEQATEEARQAMVDLFQTIDDPEVVSTYRRRLASALF
ncbi:MAG TPA: thioredoxin [Acidimicrobiia bacterium]|nr:thioredoxin [Acidimicrobiia bacterium]